MKNIIFVGIYPFVDQKKKYFLILSIRNTCEIEKRKKKPNKKHAKKLQWTNKEKINS